MNLMNYLNTREAAIRLNVNDSRVRQLIIGGRIQAIKFSGVWMIERGEIDKYAANRQPVGRPKREVLAQTE